MSAESPSTWLSIDMDLCVGHGRCHALVPELVGMDEVGDPVVLGTGDVSEAQLERARLAVANCPEGAIRLTGFDVSSDG